MLCFKFTTSKGYIPITTSPKYQGRELSLFANAKNWKKYVASIIRPYLGNDVLEVGAGIGASTCFLCDDFHRRWVCLEPDPRLAREIPATLSSCRCKRNCEVLVGTLKRLHTGERFDTILYIDVLEHVKDDHRELRRAYTHLRPNGSLVVLAPAHPRLFSEFDRAVGHYRRYTKQRLIDIAPKGRTPSRIEYLDAFGLLASATNRLWLKQGDITSRQIKLWDSILVRLSKAFHPLLRRWLGKSVLAVWLNDSLSSMTR